jgi:hypothetical protein
VAGTICPLLSARAFLIVDEGRSSFHPLTFLVPRALDPRLTLVITEAFVALSAFAAG